MLGYFSIALYRHGTLCLHKTSRKSKNVVLIDKTSFSHVKTIYHTATHFDVLGAYVMSISSCAVTTTIYGVPFVQHVQLKFGQSMLIVIPYMEHNDDGMVPVKFVLLH